jgi:hypothetical protein
MSRFECRKLENCLAGTSIYQYRLGGKIDNAFLAWLEAISATCTCRRDFPRPYFTAVLADGTQVKGVIGDVAFKVVFPDATAAASKETFETML